MITMPLIAYIAIFLVAAAVGFAVGFASGWEAAVHRYRAAREHLVESIEQLELEVAKLNTRLDEEPLRAAMSHGQTYVLNQLESLIRRLREAIP